MRSGAAEPQLSPGLALTPAQQALAQAIDAALPQTQCTRCGEPDCRRYAEAIASGRAPINRCPPGGDEGVRRLAALTGQAPEPLDSRHGREGPRQLAVIDEAACIGCALCIQACPVDCIVGVAKHMHTVIESQCTGCELCIPACPVDCIALLPSHVGANGTANDTSIDAAPPTGWAAWSAAQAEAARDRYTARNRRRAQAAAARRLMQPAAASAALAVEASALQDGGSAPQGSPQPDSPAQAAPSSAPALSPEDRKRAAIEEALRRARLRRAAAP